MLRGDDSLAPLEETIVWVEMTLMQKKMYRAVLEAKRDVLVRGVENAPLPSLLNVQIELRKCCNHPFLIRGVEESVTQGMSDAEAREAMLSASGKLILLDKLLPKLRREGHRVLLFSQFAMMLTLLAEFLSARDYSFEMLHGAITGEHRQAAIDRFCKPGSETFAFLLSTRAGGVGINLTAADTCIIFDSDWNPQNDVQAMARSHRIGQTKTVKVFRLVTRGSYEAELVQSANLKLGLERAMRGGGGGGGGLAAAGTAAGGADGGGAAGFGGAQKGPPRDRHAVERMLRCGALDIALDDDTAFNKFSEQDIDSLLESCSTTTTGQATAGEGSSFAKVAFVADGEQIDMEDPQFWVKVLPIDEQMGEEDDDDDDDDDADDDGDGDGAVRRPRRQKERRRYDEHDPIGDWFAEVRRLERHGGAGGRKRYVDRGSSDDDEEYRGDRPRRGGGEGRKRMTFESDGEDEASADAKLWAGAYAAGWRVHARGTTNTGHYYYLSPDGERYNNKSGALAASGMPPPEPRAPREREPRPPREAPPPAAATGERISSRNAARVAAGLGGRGYREPSESEINAVDTDSLLPVQPSYPRVKLRFNGRVTMPKCYGRSR